MKNVKIKLVIAAATLCLSQFVMAASHNTLTAQHSDIEHIEVNGQRSEHFYQKQLHKAEDSFFAMFNSLTENDDYHIICKRKSINGFSRLKTRVCEAKFVSKLNTDEDSGFEKKRSGNRSSASKDKIYESKKYKAKTKEQTEYMVQLINSNKALLAEYVNMSKAKQQYLSVKESG